MSNTVEGLDEDWFTPIKRLNRDLAVAAATLSDDEARFLVSTYYVFQENRKRSDNQQRALTAAEKPHAVIEFFGAQFHTTEKQIARALERYTDAHPMGNWMRQIFGIGPVLSAGLLAHINIERTETAGGFMLNYGKPTTREKVETIYRWWWREHGSKING